jgi:hypothetical protein
MIVYGLFECKRICAGSFCSDADDTSMVASSHNPTRGYLDQSTHINLSDFIDMFVPGQEIE